MLLESKCYHSSEIYYAIVVYSPGYRRSRVSIFIRSSRPMKLSVVFSVKKPCQFLH